MKAISQSLRPVLTLSNLLIHAPFLTQAVSHSFRLSLSLVSGVGSLPARGFLSLPPSLSLSSFLPPSFVFGRRTKENKPEMALVSLTTIRITGRSF